MASILSATTFADCPCAAKFAAIKKTRLSVNIFFITRI
jgi:hypothetical protein